MLIKTALRSDNTGTVPISLQQRAACPLSRPQTCETRPSTKHFFRICSHFAVREAYLRAAITPFFSRHLKNHSAKFLRFGSEGRHYEMFFECVSNNTRTVKGSPFVVRTRQRRALSVLSHEIFKYACDIVSWGVVQGNSGRIVSLDGDVV